MAVKAIISTIRVTADNRKSITPLNLASLPELSETANTINAITPIRRQLKTRRNSLSSYGSLPVIAIPIKYPVSVINTRGLKILAIIEAVLLVTPGNTPST